MYFSLMKRERKNEIPEVVVKLGIRIKDIIDEKKLKQREVAHDAGLDVENLRKYIKGIQEMKISTVFRIADALGVNINELFQDVVVENKTK